MSCCGNGRRLLTQDPQAHAGAVRVDPSVYNSALFQYTGRTRLTAVGAGTGMVYRFDGRGSRALVDGRDVASLAAVPLLVRV